jgi:hypothetical protein
MSDSDDSDAELPPQPNESTMASACKLALQQKNAVNDAKKKAVKANQDLLVAPLPTWGDFEQKKVLIEATLENLLVTEKVTHARCVPDLTYCLPVLQWGATLEEVRDLLEDLVKSALNGYWKDCVRPLNPFPWKAHVWARAAQRAVCRGLHCFTCAFLYESFADFPI